ncbi:MAG: glycine zipper domain-containing protein [Nitrococcus sp.]|nr:glycine zipper domain-containing protein [Nitrococcus sp.]
MRVFNSVRPPLFAASLALISIVGCQSLPGTPGTQGAVAGAVLGTVVGDELGDGLWETLLGGALGAAAGYLIGANVDEWTGGEPDREEAVEAVNEAQRDPATVESVYDSDTADLNGDGFVTIDEVIAMENAGLSDEEMLERLRATDQIYVLSQQQQEYLVSAGVSSSVVTQMENINQGERERFLAERDAVISAPAN